MSLLVDISRLVTRLSKDEGEKLGFYSCVLKITSLEGGLDMLRNRILSSLVFVLIVGFFILNTPEKGFAGVSPLPPITDSDCCFSHEGTGCDDAQCEDTICSFDKFCCVEGWDLECEQEALAGCSDICGPRPISNIPTLNEWALIALAATLGLFSLVVIRRRYALKAK